MLSSLEIRDMLIIDHLELEFSAGLNVLTGETGAGKSILLDALGFVLGWRGRADLVREGASQGEVVAVFDLDGDHPARAVLDEAGLEIGDELILRRVNSSDGRKTAWINDRRASGEMLRSLSEHLVELHGQHDDRGLLNPRGHLQLLDAFGGLEPLRDTVRNRWRDWRAAGRALEEARAKLARERADEDFLRHAVAELEKLEPQPGEDNDLDARRRLMQSAGRIGEDIARAHALLGGEGAEAALGEALRWLEGAAARAEGRLDAAVEAVSRALTELGEAEAEVAAALSDLAFDSAELERVEERLFAIRAAARKHDVQPDDLAAKAAELARRLSTLEAGGKEIAALEKAEADAGAAYRDAAGGLAAARREAAEDLDRAMAGELTPLKMEHARFVTVIDDAEPGPDGTDAVSFEVSTNPGTPAGPLARIASGGELSRFLLALKVCLSQGGGDQTMIFDEIDRGVGGATADAVGRRLARLAEAAQVLVVTHSPQVAALAGHHWRVAKEVRGGATLSQVEALDADARVDELARMLAGDVVTDEARGAARALLAG